MKVDRSKIKESLRRIGSRAVEVERGPRHIEDRIVPTIPVSRSDAQLVEVVNSTITAPTNFTGSLRLFEGSDEKAPWVDTSGVVPVVAEGWRVRMRTIGFRLFNNSGGSSTPEPNLELVYSPYALPSVVTEDTLWRQAITLADQARYLVLSESSEWSLVTRDFFLRPGEGLQLVNEGDGTDITAELFYRYDVAEDWLTIPR